MWSVSSAITRKKDLDLMGLFRSPRARRRGLPTEPTPSFCVLLLQQRFAERCVNSSAAFPRNRITRGSVFPSLVLDVPRRTREQSGTEQSPADNADSTHAVQCLIQFSWWEMSVGESEMKTGSVYSTRAIFTQACKVPWFFLLSTASCGTLCASCVGSRGTIGVCYVDRASRSTRVTHKSSTTHTFERDSPRGKHRNIPRDVLHRTLPA